MSMFEMMAAAITDIGPPWLDDEGKSLEKWGREGGETDCHQVAPRPSASYSKRSELIGHLRDVSAELRELAGEGFAAPAEQSQVMAEAFLNELPHDAALHCRMTISDEGEINFSFGKEDAIFRAIICGDAGLSFYGNIRGEELFGDDVDLRHFPFMKLLQVV